MAYSVKNLIVGAAALFVSVQDSVSGTLPTALPTFAANTTAVTGGANGAVNLGNDTGTAWRHAGFTTDGIELSYEPDYGEIAVDQLLDSAKLFKQGMRVSVNTTFSEATLENLVVVWGQQAASLNGDELGIAAGALGDEPVERSLVFVGPAPRDATNKKRERVYWIRRALSVESSSHTLARSDSTVFPVSFRCLPDPAFTGKEYGTALDRNVSA